MGYGSFKLSGKKLIEKILWVRFSGYPCKKDFMPIQLKVRACKCG